MTPSMIRSTSEALAQHAEALERLYKERDMLRAMLERAFDEYIGQGDEPVSLHESQAALRDFDASHNMSDTKGDP